MRDFYFILLLFLGTTCLQAQDNHPFLRFPAVNSNGTQIAFSFQGDIWVANANGGDARRLTIHEAYESRPQWSLDDAHLSFQSNRYGNDDIFITTPNGQRPKRITYYSGSDGQAKWGNNGNLLISSRRFFAEVEREAEVYQVNMDGGTPYRIMDAVGLSPAPSPDGRFVAFVRGTCRTAREAYKGPANRDIWLYDTQDQSFRQLTDFEGQDILPDWGANNTLYYLSAENGRYNIHSLSLNEDGSVKEKNQLTNYTDEGIRYFDVSADGSTIVFEKGVNLYKASTVAYQTPQQLSFNVPQDYRFDPMETKQLKDGARDLTLSPNGKYMAFSVRGEIFISPTDKEKKKTTRISKHPYNDNSPQWLNDSTLIYISDRNGNSDIYLAKSADPNQADLAKTLKTEEILILKSPEDESNLLLSPDRKRLIFQRGRGQLFLADIDIDGKLNNIKTMIDGWATPQDVSWSPDSRWIAYSKSDLDFNEEIYVHAVEGDAKPVNVSLHPRSDENPVWSADGSKLGFLSVRNNGDADVWFVWLKKSDWEKTKADWEEDDDEDEKESNGDKKDKKDEDKKKEVVIEIDFENIHERLEQVTRLPGNEGTLQISKDGETFYFSTNGGGRYGSGGEREFKSIKWDGSDEKTLLSKKNIRDLAWDKKHKELFLNYTNGTFAKLNPSGSKAENIPFSASLPLNYEQERKQIFNDAWRALRDGFYDPNFHGQDWNALKEKYEAISVAASTTQDFRDLFNEMLGQLNASHMGLYGSNPEETQKHQTGLLGIEVKPTDNGVTITRIIKNSPATRENSKLNLGETITGVNGHEINTGVNFYSTLEGTVGEKTWLTVQAADGSSREVVIRPTGNLRTALYENWVQQQKDMTEKYSNGRLGYIHIRGMNWTSFERFERELMASGLGKEGLIIDVRFNGGGWTTDMLMTVLNVRQHAYTIPRGAVNNLEQQHKDYQNYYPYGERLPLSALTKPSIAMCNENSYSNAEIFSHAYKHLGHGTLVGQPTFGAVISTGSHRLMDGSRVRMPFRAWYVKATGENMEWGPAVPDIIVNNNPDGKAKDQDAQLKKAVESLLQQIDQK
jgi:C-terminal processing protease CtpA/Prc/Tol biopolymer transport system component